MAACRSQFENDLVQAQTNEYDTSVAALYAWDLRYVTLAVGIAAGAVIANQQFETTGYAPDRTSAAPSLAFVTNLTADAPTFVRLDARAATEPVQVQTAVDAESDLDILLALRATLLFGLYLGTSSR